MIQESSSSTPTVVSPLPVLSQHTQAFGMEYYQTVGTKYYYKSDSHSGTGTSITYDYETKTWNDEGSQVPYHLNTTSTFASTTSLVNPAEIHGFGSQQNHNGTRYFSVSNPYYEAPVPNTPPSNGENGYLITNTNNATSTLEIRANGSTFTFNSATCWYYDRKTSTGSWLLQKLGFVPSTNTFIEANISGIPDQVYHTKTSSNVIKDGITVIPNAFLISNDPQSFSGAALFENPFTD